MALALTAFACRTKKDWVSRACEIEPNNMTLNSISGPRLDTGLPLPCAYRFGVKLRVRGET
jgi:hypothetical protein